MSVSTLDPALRFAPDAVASGTGLSPALLRFSLLAGGALAVAAAAGLAVPSPSLLADPELAFLLRGMAVIKAAIVLAAFGVLLWRFGHDVSRGAAVAYLGGAWLAAAATMLIWQLASVPLAALAFHAGELTMLLVAWRDHRGASQRPALDAG